VKVERKLPRKIRDSKGHCQWRLEFLPTISNFGHFKQQKMVGCRDLMGSSSNIEDLCGL
jgi:hypothetical protein